MTSRVMISELARKLLRVAAAIEPDGGANVARRFSEALPEYMRTEIGEIVFVAHGRTRHLPLFAPVGSLVAEDVLDHVLSRDRVLRIDDVSDAARFPQTRALLLRSGLRSLFVLPLSTAKELRAVAVLASSRPCAFAGVPSGTTEPLRAMAGIALAAALRMTDLDKQRAQPKATEQTLEYANDSDGLDAQQPQDAPSDAEKAASSKSQRGRRSRFQTRKD